MWFPRASLGAVHIPRHSHQGAAVAVGHPHWQPERATDPDAKKNKVTFAVQAAQGTQHGSWLR